MLRNSVPRYPPNRTSALSAWYALMSAASAASYWKMPTLPTSASCWDWVRKSSWYCSGEAGVDQEPALVGVGVVAHRAGLAQRLDRVERLHLGHVQVAWPARQAGPAGDDQPEREQRGGRERRVDQPPVPVARNTCVPSERARRVPAPSSQTSTGPLVRGGLGLVVAAVQGARIGRGQRRGGRQHGRAHQVGGLLEVAQRGRGRAACRVVAALVYQDRIRGQCLVTAERVEHGTHRPLGGRVCRRGDSYLLQVLLGVPLVASVEGQILLLVRGQRRVAAGEQDIADLGVHVADRIVQRVALFDERRVMASDGGKPRVDRGGHHPGQQPEPACKQHHECHAHAEPPRGGPQPGQPSAVPRPGWRHGVGDKRSFYEPGHGTSQCPVR